MLFRQPDRQGQMLHQGGAVGAELVQGAGTNQGLQDPPVHLLQVDAAAEVPEIAEGSLRLAGLPQGEDGALPDPLDGAQAIDEGAVVGDGELPLGGVHRGRSHLQAHGPALVDESDHLVGVVHVGAEDGGHEGGGIVGLEPEGLIGDQGIGGAMGLVEAVAGELIHQVEDVGRRPAVDAPLGRPRLEDGALLVHLRLLLLAHGAAQQVGAAQGVAGQDLGDLHHLFLVEDDAVGGLEDGLQVRVGIGHRRLAVLAGDEVVHHAGLQGPGAEQGHQGGHVLEGVGAQLLDQLLHAPGFELEDGGGLAALEQGEGRRVLGIDARNVDGGLAGLGAPGVDGLEGPVDDGQGAQAQEVELDQAHLLDVVLVELGHEVGAAGLAIEGGEVGELGRGNDHAAGVLAGVAGQALQFEGHVDEGPHLLVLGVGLAQVLALLQGLAQGHAQFEGHHLGDAIDHAVGVAQHPAHVAHHRLGRQGAEGDDLGHRLAAIAPGDVVDDPVAPLHAEVDVEVGHGDAFGVEEALEQQVVLDGVQVGDLEGIGHQGAGAGAAPRSHWDVVVLGPLDEIGHDQEVAGETHLVDDSQLQLQAVVIDRAVLRQAGGLEKPGQSPCQPFAGDGGKVLLQGHARRHGKVRQEVLAQRQFQVAALGDLQGIFQGLGDVGEEGRHLLGRA